MALRGLKVLGSQIAERGVFWVILDGVLFRLWVVVSRL